MRNCLVLFFLVPVLAHAGTWGEKSFQNDMAADWSYILIDSTGYSVLDKAFDGVPKSGYIDSDTCTVAVAAAEVVGALKNPDGAELPKEVQEWVKKNRTIYNEKLATDASKALVSCKNIARSELAQLWAEASSNSWLEQVEKLQLRLK